MITPTHALLAAEAATQYDAILQEVPPAEALQMMAEVQRWMDRRHCFFAGRPLPVVAKPVFVDSGDMDRYKRQAGLLMSAMEKLCRLYFESAELRPHFGLRAAEAELVALDPAPGRMFRLARLDAVPSPGGELRVIEFNTDACRGLLFADYLADAIEAGKPFTRLSRQFQMEHIRVSHDLLKVQLEAYREMGGRDPKPHIAIVLSSEQDVFSEPERLAEWYEEQGYPASVCDPRDLEYRNGRLFTSCGKGVGIIYRRSSVRHWVQHRRDIQGLLDAVRDRAVCVVNPLSAVLGDHKTVIPLLQRPDLAPCFSAEERQAIHDCVPWTRVMYDGPSDVCGEQVDLPAFVKEHQDELVLKPADLFGGQDVVIGRFVDSFTWLRSIELAVQRRHVVQQYVPVLELEVPSGHVTAQGSLDYVHKYATVGLFCISDLCTAGVVRVSDQPVTNITQGGGLSTVAVVSGKR